MKTKCSIVITDNGDGSARISMDFDPPVKNTEFNGDSDSPVIRAAYDLFGRINSESESPAEMITTEHLPSLETPPDKLTPENKLYIMEFFEQDEVKAYLDKWHDELIQYASQKINATIAEITTQLKENDPQRN